MRHLLIALALLLAGCYEKQARFELGDYVEFKLYGGGKWMVYDRRCFQFYCSYTLVAGSLKRQFQLDVREFELEPAR